MPLSATEHKKTRLRGLIGLNRIENGAVKKTRTSTGCPTATSTLRVYQFRHDRILVGRIAPAGLHVAKAL
jgi:hypothetical protein